jgi:L-amino acid N-acyltransferase YncA
MGMDTASISIRMATADDLPAINDIYNYYVLNSTCTYQEEPERLEDRKRWFDRHGEKHPVIVAIVEGKIVGWGSLSPFHTRSAYRFAVENSVYLDHRFHRRGIGSALLEELISRGQRLGHHTIIAGVDGEQAASLALHKKYGFAEVAHFKQVGFKFGRWLDVIYMQLWL